MQIIDKHISGTDNTDKQSKNNTYPIGELSKEEIDALPLSLQKGDDESVDMTDEEVRKHLIKLANDGEHPMVAKILAKEELRRNNAMQKGTKNDDNKGTSRQS